MSSDERKFLHDLSNPIAICFGNIKIISSKLKKDPSSVTAEYLMTRLEKTVGAFDRINDMLADRRELILAREAESKNQDSEKAS